MKLIRNKTSQRVFVAAELAGEAAGAVVALVFNTSSAD